MPSEPVDKIVREMESELANLRERSQLRESWLLARDDYQTKRGTVQRDRAAGYHANMSNLPAFGQDPSLGFDSL